ncbi:MAG: hypothetical protein CO128_09680 [Ignavibacteriales bacterium CG_4_9_14_3_um_filter_30_11]|nr:MAG: hypothetical protein CO128_09680 [Ignavibacteriales bacterium CG_4_9_14_3_um_filter_30_11]
MRNLIFIVVIFCLIIPQINSQTNEELMTEIQELNNQFAKLMIAKDFNNLLNMYTDDIYSLPSYSNIIHGKEEMIAANEIEKRTHSKWLSFNLYTKDIIEEGNLVIEIGEYNLAIEMPGGTPPITDMGKYVNIWERQNDGTLKIKVDIWNTNLNPWAPMDEIPEAK